MANQSTDENNVILSYYDYLLRSSDVNLLKGSFWLNDVIVGFYFEYLDQQYKKDGKKQLLFIGPELTQLLKMTDPMQYGIFLDPVDAISHDFIFFPLNNCDSKDTAGGSHWSLLIYSREQEMCYHYDSLKDFNNSVALNFAKNITKYFVGKRGRRYTEMDCPQQNNCYDCGLFVLCITDVISKYLLRNSNISNCDCSEVTKLVQHKRIQLLNLIDSLKNTSDD